MRLIMSHPVIKASAKHTATVIFLHGLGDTGHGWSSAFEMIRAPHIKYICPTAKVMRVTLNGGMPMPSWFDIKSLSVDSQQDEEGIRESAALLKSIVDEETKKGIDPSRIVVGGFSQGGAVALYSALTSTTTLAGILALSTWLPLHSKFPDSLKGNKSTPILQCHGTIDPVVHFNYGQMTAALLSKMCEKHDFVKYNDLGHSSHNKELQDVKEWINKVLPQM